MRCAAKVGLFVLGLPALLGGCNQIFGISQTVAYDAPTDVIADRSFVTLDWQRATVNPDGTPVATPALMPIDPMPAVRVALLGAPGAPLGAWQDPPATPASTYTVDGTVNIPRELVGVPWRFEYTLDDGVPREVQWKPEDKVGRITVPVFGRQQRDSVPMDSGAGYSVTPAGAPSLTAPRLFTTGLWTEMDMPIVMGTKADFDVSHMHSLSGLLGKPDASQGDRAVLIDYNTVKNCRVAVGSGQLTTVALTGGSHTADAPTWDTATEDPKAPIVGPQYVTRLNMIGALGDSLSQAASLNTYGAVPSISMPGLAATAAASVAEGLSLPMPVMVPVGACPYNISMPPVATPGLLGAFPKVLHAQLVINRSVMGATLSSGLESTMSASGGVFSMAFPAPFAMMIEMTPPGGVATTLGETAPEPVMFTASLDAFTLTFQPEAATDLRADAYDVILHTITGGVLTTERIYTIPAVIGQAPSVKIDGALLAKGTTYALEIRSIKGHPKAPTGDFAPVDYPYGQAIVFPRTFVVQ